jgi:hypothetical protein
MNQENIMRGQAYDQQRQREAQEYSYQSKLAESQNPYGNWNYGGKKRRRSRKNKRTNKRRGGRKVTRRRY